MKNDYTNNMAKSSRSCINLTRGIKIKSPLRGLHSDIKNMPSPCLFTECHRILHTSQNPVKQLIIPTLAETMKFPLAKLKFQVQLYSQGCLLHFEQEINILNLLANCSALKNNICSECLEISALQNACPRTSAPSLVLCSSPLCPRGCWVAFQERVPQLGCVHFVSGLHGAGNLNSEELRGHKHSFLLDIQNSCFFPSQNLQ